MTLKRNDEIKQGLVAYMKSKLTITNLLYNDDPDEIKEYNWQGTVSFYPCVRLRLIANLPILNCDGSDFTAGVMAFSEQASSAEADNIAGIIANILHDKGFSSSGIAYRTRVTNIVPAIRQDERTWRSEVLLEGSAS
jgi:hypothetical protein